jgi:hypothetical protein
VTGAEALAVARKAGLRITADGDNLLVEADAAPSAMILDALKLYKAEIMALIR